ncbi:hypothetical protein [Runella sp.]|uniref:hypothetical protein n=1 Tax=Runella sp. TaxID=1960881 RepID=UPI003D0C81BD
MNNRKLYQEIRGLVDEISLDWDNDILSRHRLKIISLTHCLVFSESHDLEGLMATQLFLEQLNALGPHTSTFKDKHLLLIHLRSMNLYLS